MRLYRRILIFLMLSIMLDLTLGSLFACPWFRPENKPGPPLGHDFLCFYTTSSMIREHQAAAAYSTPKFTIAKDIILKRFEIKYKLNCPWFYPPIFMLLVYPLAKLNYWVALSIWSLSLLTLYCFLHHKIAIHRLTFFITLVFPGAFINFINGQNGFLTTLFIGTGLFLIDKDPVFAGITLGMVSYKPHFAVLIPIALVANRNWKALSYTILSVSCITLVSLLALGWPTWKAFFKTAPLMSNLVSYGWVVIDGIVTKFPIYRMASTCASISRFSVSLGWLLQGMVSFVAFCSVFWAWRRKIPVAYRNAILVVSILLFTPYCWDYDLALLGLPLAWVAQEMKLSKTILPGQEWVLFIFFVSPGLCLLFALTLGIQLLPLFLILFLVWLFNLTRASSKATHKQIASPGHMCCEYHPH